MNNTEADTNKYAKADTSIPVVTATNSKLKVGMTGSARFTYLNVRFRSNVSRSVQYDTEKSLIYRT